jgi:CRISPR/Cas system endoribonuclease Cas6 (RAMP superfamily)
VSQQAVSRITIRFLTPTWLRAGGEVIRQPEFHHIFKRLRDRINALCAFFGDGPLDADFRGLGERAEKVRTVATHIQWVERFRTSSRTRQRHELSGFLGDATYEGELQEFLPWLALGELVHVGKHTAWGNGRIELAGRGSLHEERAI